jgi:tetratricopeptide (TPR) repeat protein
MKHTTILFIIFVPLFAVGQITHKHDSILNLIEQAENDSLKAVHYLDLGDLYQYTLQDSALRFYHKSLDIAKKNEHLNLAGKCYNYIAIVYLYQSDYDKAISLLKKSMEMKKQAGDVGGMANVHNNLGVIYKNRGNYKKALESFQKVIELRSGLVRDLSDTVKKENNIQKIAHAFNNRGNVYFHFGNYSESAKAFKKAMDYYEKIDFPNGISSCYNNLGNVFEEQKNYSKALEYYNKALTINKNNNDLRSLGICYNNIGEIRLKKNDLNKAAEYFNKSLYYRRKIDNKRGISAVYSNLAMLYMKQADYNKALNFLNQALKLDSEIGNKKGTAEDLTYIARIYLKKNKINDAIDFAERGNTLADSINAHLQEKSASKILATAWEQKGDYRKALEYTRKFEDIEDYLFNKEKNEQIEELETRYQLEKKQEEIEKQEIKLAKKEAELRKQKVLIYSFIGLLILSGTLFVLIYFNQRQKRKSHEALKKQKKEIESKNEELRQQNEEIANQRDDLERQRNLVNRQWNEIEKKSYVISSGVQHAMFIQNAILPSRYVMQRMLPDHFILFKPKDIISGDFYWVNEREDKVLIATVDCTGHDLSTAFMNFLAVYILNDIFHTSVEIRSDNILNKLRTRLIKSLQDRGINADDQNSINVSLCIWDKNDNTLQFSGAFNSLYFIRDRKLHEYKGDRLNIGMESNLDKVFTCHKIDLQQGDTIYLFTDGYYNQLSGDNFRKMARQRFKNYLLENSIFSLHEQRAQLYDYFEKWKQDYDQVDDVLLIGMRF